MTTAEKSLKSQVQIRVATEADVPFIFNSWLKSFRGSVTAKSISNPVYFDFHHKTIEKILQKSNVLIACDAADPTQVFGYVVAQNIEGVKVLHYAYVKFAFRGMGLCKLLLQDAGIDKQSGGFYTHETHSTAKLLSNSKFVYNPYLAFNV